MSRVVVVGLRPHYVIIPKLNTQHMTDPRRDHTVADPEEGPGGPAPVADPDLQIRDGPDHPDPEIRGGPVSKKSFLFAPSGLILVQK